MASCGYFFASLRQRSCSSQCRYRSVNAVTKMHCCSERKTAFVQPFCSARCSANKSLKQCCFNVFCIVRDGSWCRLCKEYSLTPIGTNLWWQKMQEKDVVGNVTSDLIALLPTNYIIAYITIWHTQVYEKTLDVNSKIAQTMQNIWNFIVKKSTLQENGTSVIIREIPDSNLETGRCGPKSGVSRISWESWQHWYWCIMNFTVMV